MREINKEILLKYIFFQKLYISIMQKDAIQIFFLIIFFLQLSSLKCFQHILYNFVNHSMRLICHEGHEITKVNSHKTNMVVLSCFEFIIYYFNDNTIYTLSTL